MHAVVVAGSSLSERAGPRGAGRCRPSGGRGRRSRRPSAGGAGAVAVGGRHGLRLGRATRADLGGARRRDRAAAHRQGRDRHRGRAAPGGRPGGRRHHRVRGARRAAPGPSAWAIYCCSTAPWLAEVAVHLVDDLHEVFLVKGDAVFGGSAGGHRLPACRSPRRWSTCGPRDCSIRWRARRSAAVGTPGG